MIVDVHAHLLLPALQAEVERRAQAFSQLFNTP